MKHLDVQSLDTFAEQWIATDRLHAQLAEEYFHRCDRYDEQFLTGRFKGEYVPATHEEGRLCMAYYAQVFRDIVEHSAITDKELFQAVRKSAEAVQP